MSAIASRLDRCRDRHQIAHVLGERISPDRKLLLDLSPIRDALRAGPELKLNG
jgi:hypothetical protein